MAGVSEPEEIDNGTDRCREEKDMSIKHCAVDTVIKVNVLERCNMILADDLDSAKELANWRYWSRTWKKLRGWSFSNLKTVT